MTGRKLVAVLLVLVLGAAGARAQFGQNQVNVKDITWRLAETEHFRIHYEPEIEGLIPRVSLYLERAYARITTMLDTPLPDKADFFLYASHNDFEQSNIVPADEGTGGVTEAFKSRFLLPVFGSDRLLEHVIAHEFTHVVEFQALFGGTWRTIRLVKSPFYPLWMMEGLAEYTSARIDDNAWDDMIMRDAAISGTLIPLEHLQNFAHLQSHQVNVAYKQGDYALRFMAGEYGKATVREFLQEYRNRFDVSSVLQATTRLDVFQFDKKFREHMEERFGRQAAGRREPEEYGAQLTRDQEFNTNPAWSADGRWIAVI